jgi:outer membrane protein
MSKRVITMSAIVALFVTGFVGSAFAQLKIGYVDAQRIFAEYEGTQEAERVYKRELDQWKAEAAQMEQEIVKLQDELRAQSLMISEEKQREKKLDLDKKVEDYQRFMKDTFGEGGVAERRNQELTKPILDRINKILSDLSEEQNYDVVFDITSAAIVYAKKEHDLTDLVIEELRKGPGAAPPATGGN